MDAKGKEVCLPNTTTPAHYMLPSNAIVALTDGAMAGVGEVVARIPQEGQKTRDITGGLHALRICSRRVNRKNRRFLLKCPALSASAKKPKASAAW